MSGIIKPPGRVIIEEGSTGGEGGGTTTTTVTVEQAVVEINNTVNSVTTDIENIQIQYNGLSIFTESEINNISDGLDHILRALDGYQQEILEISESKGQPNGIPPLDETGKIPPEFLPASPELVQEFSTVFDNEVSVGDCICFTEDNYLVRADPLYRDRMPAIGMVVKQLTGTRFQVQTSGFVRVNNTDLKPNKSIFLGIDGVLSSTPPPILTNDFVFIQTIGSYLGDGLIFISPNLMVTKINNNL
jgi:hypothetical protein